MGGIFSKKSKVPRNNSSTNNGSSGSNSITSSDLKFYLAACQNDPDVKTFDSMLQRRATAAINTLTTDSNINGFVDQQSNYFSLDSVAQVTGSLMDVSHESVKVILDFKEDILKNKELLSLVEDYLEYSVQTLEFFTALNQCLKRARDRHFIMQAALRRFEEEMKVNEDDDDVKERFARTLQELRSFKEAGDPFGEEFFTIFQSVYTQQLQMFKTLQIRKQKLDKKLNSLKVYRKVCNIIFGAAFVAVVICSVVAAAFAAPPVASALAAAVSAPIGGVGKWFNSLWKKYEREFKDGKELLLILQRGTLASVKDLQNIRVLVEKLEIVIESLLSNAEFAVREPETLTMVMADIRNKLCVFMEGIDSIRSHSDIYSREIRQARTVILDRIRSFPNARI